MGVLWKKNYPPVRGFYITLITPLLLTTAKLTFVFMIIIVLLFLFLPMGPSPWWTTLHLVTIPTHASERQALHFGHPC